eukprot:6570913-Prymnesium_polylepis.1
MSGRRLGGSMSRGVVCAVCAAHLVAPTTPRVARRASGGLRDIVAGGAFQGRMEPGWWFGMEQDPTWCFSNIRQKFAVRFVRTVHG